MSHPLRRLTRPRSRGLVNRAAHRVRLVELLVNLIACYLTAYALRVRRSASVTVGFVSVRSSPERDVLLGRLASERQHVLAQLEGLSDEQLRQPVLPSGWSCLGLVRHLTLSDERYWFEVVVAGEPLSFWPEGENGDWRVQADDSTADVIEAYHSAIRRSDAIIAARRLDDPPEQPEDWWDDAGLDFPDVRTILVHVLVETAVHAGHLDAVREMLDGHQHLVI